MSACKKPPVVPSAQHLRKRATVGTLPNTRCDCLPLELTRTAAEGAAMSRGRPCRREVWGSSGGSGAPALGWPAVGAADSDCDKYKCRSAGCGTPALLLEVSRKERAGAQLKLMSTTFLFHTAGLASCSAQTTAAQQLAVPCSIALPTWQHDRRYFRRAGCHCISWRRNALKRRQRWQWRQTNGVPFRGQAGKALLRFSRGRLLPCAWARCLMGRWLLRIAGSHLVPCLICKWRDALATTSAEAIHVCGR